MSFSITHCAHDKWLGFLKAELRLSTDSCARESPSKILKIVHDLSVWDALPPC